MTLVPDGRGGRSRSAGPLASGLLGGDL
ncbi:MAG: hypothetical protein QOI10_4665, partial [Solirubrobacterales bacterium]|nr:hypothetical protein [Solirubrobacterales bacterium]